VGRLGATWDRSASCHHHEGTSPAFDRVRLAVLAKVGPAEGLRVVDLGAGICFVALALAREVDEVLAVDASPVLVDALAKEAADRGFENVHCLVEDLAVVDLAAASVDVVVSSFALHHLRNAEKSALVRRAGRWLRPGGRLVIADQMFGRPGSGQRGRVGRTAAAAPLRMGSRGAWRVVRNMTHFGRRMGVDRPASPEFWVNVLQAAGFADVCYQPIIAEVGVVSGVCK